LNETPPIALGEIFFQKNIYQPEAFLSIKAVRKKKTKKRWEKGWESTLIG